MKALLLLLLPVILLASSCKKTTPNRTIVVDVPSTNWKTANGGQSYTTWISIPEIDDATNEAAGVLVYMSFGDRVYEQIPQVYSGNAYSFITEPGGIELEVQRYDAAGIVLRPAGSTVKIVIVYSDL